MTVLYVQLFHIANFVHALAHARPTMSHIPLVSVWMHCPDLCIIIAAVLVSGVMSSQAKPIITFEDILADYKYV